MTESIPTLWRTETTRSYWLAATPCWQVWIPAYSTKRATWLVDWKSNHRSAVRMPRGSEGLCWLTRVDFCRSVWLRTCISNMGPKSSIGSAFKHYPVAEEFSFQSPRFLKGIKKGKNLLVLSKCKMPFHRLKGRFPVGHMLLYPSFLSQTQNLQTGPHKKCFNRLFYQEPRPKLWHFRLGTFKSWSRFSRNRKYLCSMKTFSSNTSLYYPWDVIFAISIDFPTSCRFCLFKINRALVARINSSKVPAQRIKSPSGCRGYASFIATFCFCLHFFHFSRALLRNNALCYTSFSVVNWCDFFTRLCTIWRNVFYN